jgi:hypothetical protein
MKKCKKQKKNAKKSKGKKSGITYYKKVKSRLNDIRFWAFLIKGFYEIVKELIEAIL